MLRIKVARVQGTSMLPQLNDQDYVVAVGWPWLRLRPGQIVMILHPYLGLIIKRIFTVKHQCYTLVGDHSSSISSEKIGWVRRSQIIGRVIFHIPKNA